MPPSRPAVSRRRLVRRRKKLSGGQTESPVRSPRDGLWSSFEYLCAAGHNAIHDAAIAYFYDHDVEAIWNTVMRAFSPMTVQAAYVAAWIDADGLQIPRLENSALETRMLGEAWREVISAFRTLPAADVEASRQELEARVIEIAHRFDDWLDSIGFGCEQLDDGALYFHVYEHENWVTREPIDDNQAA